MSAGEYAFLVLGLTVLSFLALSAAVVGWTKFRKADRALRNHAQSLTDWRRMNEASRQARWEPRFDTDAGNVLEIQLVRSVDLGTGSPKELNSLTIGEVDLDQDGWEQKMDDLVLTARARMHELNAFIDSYTVLGS